MQKSITHILLAITLCILNGIGQEQVTNIKQGISNAKHHIVDVDEEQYLITIQNGVKVQVDHVISSQLERVREVDISTLDNVIESYCFDQFIIISHSFGLSIIDILKGELIQMDFPLGYRFGNYLSAPSSTSHYFLIQLHQTIENKNQYFKFKIGDDFAKLPFKNVELKYSNGNLHVFEHLFLHEGHINKTQVYMMETDSIIKGLAVNSVIKNGYVDKDKFVYVNRKNEIIQIHNNGNKSNPGKITNELMDYNASYLITDSLAILIQNQFPVFQVIVYNFREEKTILDIPTEGQFGVLSEVRYLDGFVWFKNSPQNIVGVDIYQEKTFNLLDNVLSTDQIESTPKRFYLITQNGLEYIDKISHTRKIAYNKSIVSLHEHNVVSKPTYDYILLNVNQVNEWVLINFEEDQNKFSNVEFHIDYDIGLSESAQLFDNPFLLLSDSQDLYDLSEGLEKRINKYPIEIVNGKLYHSEEERICFLERQPTNFTFCIYEDGIRKPIFDIPLISVVDGYFLFGDYLYFVEGRKSLYGGLIKNNSKVNIFFENIKSQSINNEWYYPWKEKIYISADGYPIEIDKQGVMRKLFGGTTGIVSFFSLKDQLFYFQSNFIYKLITSDGAELNPVRFSLLGGDHYSSYFNEKFITYYHYSSNGSTWNLFDGDEIKIISDKIPFDSKYFGIADAHLVFYNEWFFEVESEPHYSFISLDDDNKKEFYPEAGFQLKGIEIRDCVVYIAESNDNTFNIYSYAPKSNKKTLIFSSISDRPNAQLFQYNTDKKTLFVQGEKFLYQTNAEHNSLEKIEFIEMTPSNANIIFDDETIYYIGSTKEYGNQVMRSSIVYDTACVSLNKIQQIKSFPNPTDQWLNLELIDSDNYLEYSLFTNKGECLVQKNIMFPSESIDVSNLPVGLYYLIINQNDKSYQTAFAKY